MVSNGRVAVGQWVGTTNRTIRSGYEVRPRNLVTRSVYEVCLSSNSYLCELDEDSSTLQRHFTSPLVDIIGLDMSASLSSEVDT